MKKLKDICVVLIFAAWLGSIAYGAVYNWGYGDYSGTSIDSKPTGTLRDGQRFFEIQPDNTVKIYVVSNGTWTLVTTSSGGTGTTIHGGLTGLSANDHPQYLLLANLTGTGMVYRTAGSPSVVSAGSSTSCVWGLDESGVVGCYTSLVVSLSALTGQGEGILTYSGGVWTSVSTTSYSAATHTHDYSASTHTHAYSATTHTHSVTKTLTFGFSGGGSVLSATTDTVPLLSYETGTLTRYDLSCYPSGTVSINLYAALNSVPSATTDLVTTISITNSTVTGTTGLSTFTTTTTADGKRWVARVTGTPAGSTACSLVLRYLSTL